MKARYILRFDDVCPTMNWAVWAKIERILHAERVRPILGVVPDNQDDVLRISAPDERFWDRVRNWQASGWTIGMHGYQHRFVTNESGILRVNEFSEFAGLPVEEQERKVRSGLCVFRSQDVQSSLWIAPAHSFDETTLRVLRTAGFTTVSDGFFIFPHVDELGLTWVPQQLWSFRRRPFGVWTICLHMNGWTENDVRVFRENLILYRDNIASLSEVLEVYGNRKKTKFDRALGFAYYEAAKAAAVSRSHCGRL
jgi:predicted deacetylase